ncbi:hypothetical protein GCM10027034_14100 [Ramlibacter solisilvae]|uniref:DUF1905 domain-containing protein n=1 Tax=Ramlibacter tataouinensis TaxID=94132 RepID=A0A127JWV0_9BURK|nr:YdeI/OmpD-associated family protein [Ramlibacter tataouinensis]AMO24359.1 hypothetical protein UC35_17780 [Ramlibacter tataouinensis]
MKFTCKVIPSGNATAVEIPKAAVEALGAGARPPISVSINGHTWRTRIALMRGQCLVGISAANRAAAGIASGETVDVILELDDVPREVTEPPDLKEALDADPSLRAAFTRLAFGLKQKHIRSLVDAKTPETRQRRLAKLAKQLQQGTT